MSGWFYLLQQSACAWSLLLSLGLCMGLRGVRPWRLAAASLACGSVSLAGAALPGLLSGLFLLLIILLAPAAAWPGVPRSRQPSMMLCCILLTLLMAGITRCLYTFGLRRMPLLLGQFALLPLFIHMAPSVRHASCITLEIQHKAKHLRLTALVDSGNLLRDPVTHLPVIVISRQAASRLCPGGTFFPGMRLISVRTVGGSSLMPVFRPQSVRLLQAHGWQAAEAVIGLSPDGYSGFQALVPASVTTSPQGGISICP